MTHALGERLAKGTQAPEGDPGSRRRPVRDHPGRVPPLGVRGEPAGPCPVRDGRRLRRRDGRGGVVPRARPRAPVEPRGAHRAGRGSGPRHRRSPRPGARPHRRRALGAGRRAAPRASSSQHSRSRALTPPSPRTASRFERAAARPTTSPRRSLSARTGSLRSAWPPPSRLPPELAQPAPCDTPPASPSPAPMGAGSWPHYADATVDVGGHLFVPFVRGQPSLELVELVSRPPERLPRNDAGVEREDQRSLLPFRQRLNLAPQLVQRCVGEAPRTAVTVMGEQA